MYKIVPVFLLLVIPSILSAQETANRHKLHSHNDYLRNAPFWEAFSNQVESIEADVLLLDNELYVAHEEESVKKERTLTSLYLEPIRKAFELDLGEMKEFQLLIDIKTEPYSTLRKIEEVLGPFQDILTDTIGRPKVNIVISGNRPDPKDYPEFADYIQFDYQSVTEISDLPLEKIAMISLNFKNFSSWNGKGRITDKDRESLNKAIQVAHSLNRPIRFWGSPDSKTAWKAFKELGIDYINTDQPYEASAYLKTLEERIYANVKDSEIYTPEFKVDGTHKPLKNVILFIGDGNGLAQISAALYVNNNSLNLAALKNIGFIKTQSADDFTTDSAAAGTALASGEKANNRSIGIHPDGQAAQNLPEYLQQYQYLTGLVTADHVTGATPASFYAHQSDRDMTKAISIDLTLSPIDLFIGGGREDFEVDNGLERLSKAGFSLLPSLEEIGGSTSERVGFFASSDGLGTVAMGREGFLPQATEEALSYLSRNENPFFLMVEGAMIDTGGHNNHPETVIEEGIDFDRAIAKALKFADEDGETLVVITADHETGGITIPHGNLENGEVELAFETQDHTGVMVPIFAYGPHSDEFRGIYENSAVFHKIIRLIEKYSSQ